MNGIKSTLGVAISLAVLVKLSEKYKHFLLLARLLILTTLGLTPAPTSLFPATAVLPQTGSCTLPSPFCWVMLSLCPAPTLQIRLLMPYSDDTDPLHM